MGGEEARHVGFYNKIYREEELQREATAFAHRIAGGPALAHAMTKRMMVREWDMNVIDAVNEEAEAQARCMETQDFRRAYEAFVNKERPKFEGN